MKTINLKEFCATADIDFGDGNIKLEYDDSDRALGIVDNSKRDGERWLAKVCTQRSRAEWYILRCAEFNGHVRHSVTSKISVYIAKVDQEIRLIVGDHPVAPPLNDGYSIEFDLIGRPFVRTPEDKYIGLDRDDIAELRAIVTAYDWAKENGLV